MADIELVIKMPKEVYKDIMIHNREMRESGKSAYYFEGLIKNGTPLPKGYGKIVDIGKILPKGYARVVDINKIDKDMIEFSNSVIGLMIGGECIEVVSLDYLNTLEAIIEADKE